MEWKTHLVGGVAAALGFTLLCNGNMFGIEPQTAVAGAAGLVCGAAGGLFPDIDLQTSKIGRKTKGVSSIIQRIVGHRTLFHAPLLYALLALWLMRLFPPERYYILSFTIGAMSHILLDMLNTPGIPLLYPLPGRLHIMNIKTGGKGEKIVFVLMAICFIAGIVVFIKQYHIPMAYI